MAETKKKPAVRNQSPSRRARARNDAWPCWSRRARAHGCSMATRRAGPGVPTARISSATSSAIWCSIRATGERCSQRRRPAISARRSSARPIAAARWKEAARPPAFAKAADGEKGRAVDHTFWLTPATRERAERLVRRHFAAGIVPLRGRRRDAGSRFPTSTRIRNTASGWARCRTARRTARSCIPIVVDPRDPAHLYFAMSGGGVHESVDGGKTFKVAHQRARCGRRIRFRPRRAHVPRSALRAHLSEQSGSLVSAEPLRHLPHRSPLGRMDAHRQEHAEARGRHRLPARRASARCQYRLGVPDGRHQRLAAHEPGGQARGVRHAQCRHDLAAPRRRVCPKARPGGP